MLLCRRRWVRTVTHRRTRELSFQNPDWRARQLTMADWIELIRSFHFDGLWFLLLLPVLALAFIIGLTRKRPSLTVPSLQTFRDTVARTGRSLSAVRLPVLLESLGCLLLIVALIRPQFGIEEMVRRAEGIDIMLLLDISGSMQAIDIPKTNSDARARHNLNSGKYKPRIDVAKEKLKKFVDRRVNDRIGLIAFSGHSYTVCPPTLDHAFLKRHLDRLEAGMLQDGTGIAAPIASATSRLLESEAKRRVAVLFTDGDNNVDAKITPLQAAKIAGMEAVTVYTVGAGSDYAFAQQQHFFGRMQWVHVPARFNDTLLQNIADETKGLYFKAKDNTALESVMTEIDGIETISFEQPRYIDYKELHPKWLLAGMALLILALIIEHSISLKVP